MPASTDDTVAVPDGYLCDVLIPWGTPLFADSPRVGPDASNTAADQALQVGFNHDGMHFFPLGDGTEGSRHGLLVLNHEYTDANQIYTAAQGTAITTDDAGREKVAKALAGHGVTVVEVASGDDGTGSTCRARRSTDAITGTTPMAFSGPVGADHPHAVVGHAATPVGHAQQLRPRVHAVGHLPGVRGELERLLRHRRRTWTPTRSRPATA